MITTTTSRQYPRWPLLLIAAPAGVATWSGWVGLGEATGFGKVSLLPGIWDNLKVNTAITLPIGVEAYAAYAIGAALSSANLTPKTRRFAGWSGGAALALGMIGQAAFHVLAATTEEGRQLRAPIGVTIMVSCLPVLILGMAAALSHMLHRDVREPLTNSESPLVAQDVRPLTNPLTSGGDAALTSGPSRSARQALTSGGRQAPTKTPPRKGGNGRVSDEQWLTRIADEIAPAYEAANDGDRLSVNHLTENHDIGWPRAKRLIAQHYGDEPPLHAVGE
jgi:hypothetical protein